MTASAAFLEALAADGPSADRVGDMDLYSWLIGSWDLEVSEFDAGGVTRVRDGEWHFGWVLEGRAIQDAWIVPARGGRTAAEAIARAEYYGTTFRVFDPRIHAWRIQWIDPVAQAYLSMIGRPDGDDIVQDGKDSAGHRRRWSFSQITRDRFRWRGEVSTDEGRTWFLNMEYFATRRPGEPAKD